MANEAVAPTVVVGYFTSLVNLSNVGSISSGIESVGGTVSADGSESTGWSVFPGFSSDGISFSQHKNAVRRSAAENILNNLFIVVDYHVGCIESEVSVRIVENELECMLAALEAVLREDFVLSCDVVERHEEVLYLLAIDESRN